MSQSDAFYVDCGITYSGASTATITGLDHLEKETVAVLGDGAYLGTYTVSGGSITLTEAVTTAQVGLPYSGTLKPTKIDIEGLGLTTIKNIHKAVISFYETLGGQYGSNAASLDTITFRTGSDDYDSPPSLFTGIKDLTFSGSYAREGDVIVKQNQPLPMTVRGIILGLGVEDT